MHSLSRISHFLKVTNNTSSLLITLKLHQSLRSHSMTSFLLSDNKRYGLVVGARHILWCFFTNYMF